MSSSTSFTYNELIAALQNWLEEGAAEFTVELPTVVSMGETRLATDFNLEIFDTIATGALTPNVNIQAIKLGTWQGTRSLWTEPVGGGARTFLQRRTLEYCQDFQPDETVGAAQPQYFAEQTETEIFVAPSPDVAYPFRLRQVASPDALTVANQNTWLGDNHGDILFNACLVASEQFLKSDQGEIDVHKTIYGELLGARKLEAREMWRAQYNPIGEAARTVSLT